MNPRPPANVPPPLSLARRELDQWRKQQHGRKRLPRELWLNAVRLAREQGLNKTARMRGLKYDSLKKPLEAAAPGASGRGGIVSRSIPGKGGVSPRGVKLRRPVVR